MQPTLRGTLVLLLISPLIAAAAWLPIFRWAALIVSLLIIGIMVLDWRQAGPVSRFQVSREHDTKFSLGADNPVRLVVRTLRPRPVSFSIRDEPPDEFRVDQRIFSGVIAPRQAWSATYHLMPFRRGDYMIGDLNLRWTGPLGLVVRQGKLKAESRVKVYPNMVDVHRYDLLMRRNRLQELGLRNTRIYGEGSEFERLREYLPDDEFRRINWKATARRNRPVTVEYQTERSQNIVTLVDTGRLMQSPVARVAKLDYVINAVLLLGYVASGMGDKVGLMTFADDVQQYLAPRQGRGQFYRMLEILYAVKSQPIEPDYRRALSYLAVKHRKRSLIVIFTDLSGGITMNSLISHVSILARHNLPLVVTISDPDVVAASRQMPTDSLTVYQRAAAAHLLDERQVALDTLRQHGVLTLDVPANRLSWSVINRYLELKGKGRL